jgi:hypothetical protein
MAVRAQASGRRLSAQDAAQVRRMIKRGDCHHDIAAWFGVNQGRIAEVNEQTLHPGVAAAPPNQLPPPGPYTSGRSAQMAITALQRKDWPGERGKGHWSSPKTDKWRLEHCNRRFVPAFCGKGEPT